MDSGGSQEDVDTWIGGPFESFPSAIDVGVVASGQPTNGYSTHGIRDGPHRLKVPWRSDRKSCFDDVDSKIDESLSDFEFLREIHAATGRLLAIAKRCVEDSYGSHFGTLGHWKLAFLVKRP